MMVRKLTVACLLCSSFLCTPAFADLTFEPTADEWATWPAYCRAKYASMAFQIQDTQLVKQIPKSEIDRWTTTLGPMWVHVHHYCFALSTYARSMTEMSGPQHAFLLNSALLDVKYTYERIETKDPLGPETATLYAQVENELGRPDHARRLLTAAIEAAPTAAPPYLVLSSIERKSGNVSGAIKVLESGNKSTDFKSAEINYFLGLLYFDQRNYPAARECATRAYDLGYPLPGLRQKLKNVGQ